MVGARITIGRKWPILHARFWRGSSFFGSREQKKPKIASQSHVNVNFSASPARRSQPADVSVRPPGVSYCMYCTRLSPLSIDARSGGRPLLTTYVATLVPGWKSVAQSARRFLPSRNLLLYIVSMVN